MTNCEKMHISRFQNQEQQMVISMQRRVKERDGGRERERLAQNPCSPYGTGDRQTKLTHSPHLVICYSGEVMGINCLAMDVTENK